MKLVFGKTGNLHKFSTITIFIRLLYLVTFTADVGLFTTLDYYDYYYFMVELVAIPRYSFLTFFSRIIFNYKQPFALVSNKKMGLTVEFTQLRMHFKVFCRGFVPH